MRADRLSIIRDYINGNGEATIAELTRLCGDCSSMTLWRDLKKLETEGCIRRVRGGAISVRPPDSGVEGYYDKRARENVEQKRSIAFAALAHVSAGVSLYMDAGSTIMGLARMLPDERFTIITSGANIAIELSRRGACNVMLVGGQLSSNTLSCSGAQSESFIESVNIETAIMATSGYSAASGFTSGSFSESALKRSVIDKAAHVIMLMDSSKIGRALPFTFAGIEDIDMLITDTKPDETLAKACRSGGVDIVVA